jgi:hypothetical protein
VAWASRAGTVGTVGLAAQDASTPVSVTSVPAPFAVGIGDDALYVAVPSGVEKVPLDGGAPLDVPDAPSGCTDSIAVDTSAIYLGCTSGPRVMVMRGPR